MLQLTGKHRVYVGTIPIDFRKGIDSIVALCQTQWQTDPRSGHVFLFTNRRATSLKLLNYDGQGYWLCQKRLSAGSFSHWPRNRQGVICLTVTQLHVLLANGDPLRVETSAPFTPIG